MLKTIGQTFAFSLNISLCIIYSGLNYFLGQAVLIQQTTSWHNVRLFTRAQKNVTTRRLLQNITGNIF